MEARLLQQTFITLPIRNGVRREPPPLAGILYRPFPRRLNVHFSGNRVNQDLKTIRSSIIQSTSILASGRCNQNRSYLRLKQQMRSTILLLALLLPTTARAQTAQPMTEKLCAEQGKDYVTEKNRDEPAPESGRSFYWTFVTAHYDLKEDSCYVMYDRFVQGFGRNLQQIRIDDSAGNHIAVYSATWVSTLDGRHYSKPSECEVDGTSCDSMREFEDLIRKFIPPFRKNTPRRPIVG